MIKLIEFEKEMLVIKSFTIPNAFNRFIYTYFRQSKAKRAYDFGLKIAQFTPKVVARVEYYQPLLDKSHFIKFGIKYNQQLKARKTRKLKIKQFFRLCRFGYRFFTRGN